MRNIAIKLAARSDTIVCDFDENLEKFKFWPQHMEKYAAECKNQSLMSKLSL